MQTVPQIVDGVRTEIIPTTAQAVASGAVPQAAVSLVAIESSAVPPLSSIVLNQAIAAKQQIEQNLMKREPSILSASGDRPEPRQSEEEAALVIFVDRRADSVNRFLPPSTAFARDT